MRRNERDTGGNEILKEKGGRDFYFHGRHFHISDLIGKKDSYKYYVTEIDDKGFPKTLLNTCGWVLQSFKTIREARRFVADWEDFLQPLD